MNTRFSVILPDHPDYTVQLRSGVDFRDPEQVDPWTNPDGKPERFDEAYYLGMMNAAIKPNDIFANAQQHQLNIAANSLGYLGFLGRP